MKDERFEQLLVGYRPPEVTPELDQRVLENGTAILERARLRAALADAGHALLDALGFGYVTWLTDLVTARDAEYGVELI